MPIESFWINSCVCCHHFAKELEFHIFLQVKENVPTIKCWDVEKALEANLDYLLTVTLIL